MCYNCGCKIKNDPMGKGHIHEGGASLTEQAFEHMAEVWQMSITETKKEVMELLKKELNK